MSRSTLFVLWIASVVVAAMVGWFSGISNAARVATGSANALMYVLLLAIVAVAGTLAFSAFRHRHSNHEDRTPQEPMLH